VQDAAFQLKHKTNVGRFTIKQVVPGLQWAVVPSPVIEVRPLGEASPGGAL